MTGRESDKDKPDRLEFKDRPTAQEPRAKVQPSVGRIVHTWVQLESNNGSHVAPAVINRVWNEDSVNLTVFLDSDTGPVRRTSARFVEELPGPDENPTGVGHVWTWPPRT